MKIRMDDKFIQIMDEKLSTWMILKKIMTWLVQIDVKYDHLPNLFMKLSNFWKKTKKKEF
jgi:hypothetical protein